MHICSKGFRNSATKCYCTDATLRNRGGDVLIRGHLQEGAYSNSRALIQIAQRHNSAKEHKELADVHVGHQHPMLYSTLHCNEVAMYKHLAKCPFISSMAQRKCHAE